MTDNRCFAPQELRVGHEYRRPPIAPVDWGYGTVRRLYATGRHPIELLLHTTTGAEVRGELVGVGAGTLTVQAATGERARIASTGLERFTILGVGDTSTPACA